MAWRHEIVALPYAFWAMDPHSLGRYPAATYVMTDDVDSVNSGMIADGEITDDDISGDAAIDPEKVSGTAWTSTKVKGSHLFTLRKNINQKGKATMVPTVPP